MTELSYQDHTEEADLAGLTVAEVREMYQREGGLPSQTTARLNGRKLDKAGEAATVLDDDDSLAFKPAGKSRKVYLVGALFLALAVTGGIFAYGFSSGTVTLGASVTAANFAEVTANTSSPPDWGASGLQLGATGNGTLFDVSTAASGYTGDLVVSVSLGNTGELSNIYRVLNMSLEVRDSAGNIMDINGDGTADSNDFAVLTLQNGSVDLPITQSAADFYTIMLRNGSFKCTLTGSSWNSADNTPMLFCEVSQR